MGITSLLVYKLKQSWGVPITLYTQINATPDRKTGKMIMNHTKTKIKKAVIVPLRVSATNPNKTDIEIGNLEIIIAETELPEDYQPGAQDYFVYKNVRYNIISFVRLDNKVGFYFRTRYTQREKSHNIFDVDVSDSLETGEKNGSN